jgi:hypothetical protein
MNEIAEILETVATAPINKRAMTNLSVLNEAYHYVKPSSFSRGMRIDLNGLTILYLFLKAWELLFFCNKPAFRA